MWIVKNVLRGALYVDDLDVKIPPKEYFDLDDLGRDRVEQSSTIRLALEEGYLQNIKKDDSQEPSDTQLPEPAVDGREELDAISDRLRDLQDLITRGFTLSQIEARLNLLQEEMSHSGAYSDRLQSLMQEFRNTLLARAPAPQPAPVVMQAPPAAPVVSAQPAEADPASLSGMQADLIKERMNTILESLHGLQQSVILTQQAGATSTPQVSSSPASEASNQTAQEIERLIDDVNALRTGVASRPAEMQDAVSPDGLSDELSDFRKLLLGDFRRLMRDLPRAAPTSGDQTIANADDMTDSELKARLQVLTEKECEVKANFNQIGKITEGDGGAQSMADLLCDI